MTAAAQWRGTSALRRGAGLGAFVLGVGLAIARPDLAVLGVPLVVATAVGLSRRPSGVPQVSVSAPALTSVGETASVMVRVVAPRGADLVTVRVPADGDPVGRAVTFGGDGGQVVARSVPKVRGPAGVARPDHLACAADGLLVVGPVAGAQSSAVVLPRVEPVPAGPLPPRPAGVVGAHRTRRPGEGSDLVDVRPLPGGQVARRVDWRATARAAARHPALLTGDDASAVAGSLHVRRTAVDADADVALAIDTRLDVGADVASWPQGAAAQDDSSLERSVRAAAALAGAHLEQGDRVALLDLARPRASVAGGTGRRHLLRLRFALAGMVVPRDGRRLPRTASQVHRALHHVPGTAVVALLSPFLDAEPVELAIALRRTGRRVLAVDVLPGSLVPDRRTRSGADALALVMAERAERLASLAGHGVAVVPWEPAVVVPVLRSLVRASARSRSA